MLFSCIPKTDSSTIFTADGIVICEIGENCGTAGVWECDKPTKGCGFDTYEEAINYATKLAYKKSYYNCLPTRHQYSPKSYKPINVYLNNLLV